MGKAPKSKRPTKGKSTKRREIPARANNDPAVAEEVTPKVTPNLVAAMDAINARRNNDDEAPDDATNSQPEVAGDANVARINFDEAVREGKQIIAEIAAARAAVDVREGRLLRLGELADQIKTDHGPSKLGQFAKALGIAKCTVDRHINVYSAWAENPAPGPISYAVARELQKHPDRFNIIQQHPNLTKSKAHSMMVEHRRDEAERDPNWRRDQTKKWFDGVVELGNKVEREAEITNQLNNEAILRDVIEPKQ